MNASSNNKNRPRRRDDSGSVASSAPPAKSAPSASSAPPAAPQSGFSFANLKALAASRCLAYPLLTFALSILCGGIAGRAIWCDEILRIKGQSMTIQQLLDNEHLRTFCTQSAPAYLFMRPFQKLLGMETGGFLLAALCAAAVAFCALHALRLCRGGREPGHLISLVVATNPLLIYYGSELSFYSQWAAAFAVAFSLALVLANGGLSPRRRRLAAAGFLLAGSAFVAFHYAGAFVWLGMSAAALAILMMERAAPLKIARAAVMLALPLVVNLRHYLDASDAPRHIGSKALNWSSLPALPAKLWAYFAELFPSFYGRVFIGLLFVIAALAAAARRDAAARKTAAFSVCSILSVALFLSYSHLRDYMPDVARYWVYALAPALLLLALGIDAALALPRKSARIAAAAAASILLAANIVADAGLATSAGRPHPYKKIIDALAEMPPGVPLAYANNYETRFLGSYYKLPSGAPSVFPCLYEAGRDARVNGLKNMLRLKPDLALVVPDASAAREGEDAGFGAGPGWSRLEFNHSPLDVLLPWWKTLHPEPLNKIAAPNLLMFKTRDALARESDASGKPLAVPSENWRHARFNTASGELRQCLVAAGADTGTAPIISAIEIHIPAAAVSNAVSATRSVQLQLDVLSYKNNAFKFSVANSPFSAPTQMPADSGARFQAYDNNVYAGLPPPEGLMSYGEMFAIQSKTARASFVLSGLVPGWNRIEISASAPWLLLSHDAQF